MSNPMKIKLVVDDVMRKLTPGNMESVRERWDIILGEEIAMHSVPVSIKEGKLLVVVDSSPWLQHLTMKKKDILGKLRKDSLYKSVDEIRFKQGKI